MKQIIITILSNGFTTSKKYNLEDCIKYLYFLKYIFKTNSFTNCVCCNDNVFWLVSNNQNRIELLHDIIAIHKADIKDSAYFRIINRFENGDKYGIEIPQEVAE